MHVISSDEWLLVLYRKTIRRSLLKRLACSSNKSTTGSSTRGREIGTTTPRRQPSNQSVKGEQMPRVRWLISSNHWGDTYVHRPRSHANIFLRIVVA